MQNRIKYFIAILILIPILVSLHTTPGTTNYHDLRISEEVISGEYQDSLTQRSISFDPYLYVLGHTNFKLLPIIISITILLLFGYMIKEDYALLALVISPIFVKSLIIASSNTLALLFFSIGIFFINKKKNVGYVFLLPLIAFPLYAFVMLIVLLSYFGLSEKVVDKKLLAIVVMSAIYHYMIGFSLGNIQTTFMADFGVYGFGIFAMLLAAYFLFHSIRKFKLLTFIMLLTFSLSFIFGNQLHIFTNVFLAYFAGLGLKKLSEREWQQNYLKILAVLAIVCGLFLSYVSCLQVMSFPNQARAYDWISENTDESAFILSNPEYGFWIQHFSNRQSIDMYYDDYTLNQTDTLFQSRDLHESKLLLKELSIDYIFIDDIMKQKLWIREDQGLLFLFRNHETFELVYDESDGKIWKVHT